MLETATVTSGGALSVATPIPLMDWERYTQALAQDVLREQSPRQLLACRARVYELLVNCIPADVIMKRLAAFLTAETGLSMGAGAPRVLPEETRHELAHWAAHYEHRLQLGSKELFHIEAFIAKAMAVIRAAPAPGAGAGAGAGGAASAMSASSVGSGAAAAGSAASFASAGSGAASRPGLGAMGGAGAGR